MAGRVHGRGVHRQDDGSLAAHSTLVAVAGVAGPMPAEPEQPTTGRSWRYWAFMAARARAARSTWGGPSTSTTTRLIVPVKRNGERYASVTGTPLS